MHICALDLGTFLKTGGARVAPQGRVGVDSECEAALETEYTSVVQALALLLYIYRACVEYTVVASR